MGVLKEDLTRLVPFGVDESWYALGAINVHGDVVPVVDVTRRLGFPSLAPAEIARLIRAVAQAGKGR
jgi:chemotaxis signal transduction protein